MLARLGALPRLEQVDERIEIGDEHAEEDEHEDDPADPVPADPAGSGSPPPPPSRSAPRRGICPAAHAYGFAIARRIPRRAAIDGRWDTRRHPRGNQRDERR